MPITHIVVLALLQGLTEFLPVSSSAHLIFPSQLLGWEDQGLAFDVAVHLGTLLAVIIYYMSDLVQIGTHTIESAIKRKQTPLSRIGWFIIIATIPAAAAGLLLEPYIATVARSIHVIAYTTIGFGILLGIASYINRKINWSTIVNIQGRRSDSLRGMTIHQAIIIGFAQALALVPGTSRSGITLTIPIILASALLEGIKLFNNETIGANPIEMLIGGVISFVTSIIVISLFMRYISKSGMAVFVVYRVLLGVALLYFFY